jgi:hypothetical protein
MGIYAQRAIVMHSDLTSHNISFTTLDIDSIDDYSYVLTTDK